MINKVVIIPAYKAAAWIGNCLDSIARQTTKPKKVMVGVDNCEETAKAATDYAKASKLKIEVYFFREHCGPYRIKNTLAALAEADILLFFDSDDTMSTLHVKAMSKDLKPGQFRLAQEVNPTRPDKIFPFTDGLISVWRHSFLLHGGFEPWGCAADSEARQRWQQGGMEISPPDTPTVNVTRHAGSLTTSEATGLQSPFRQKLREEIKCRREFPVRLTALSIGDCTRIYPVFKDAMPPISIKNAIPENPATNTTNDDEKDPPFAVVVTCSGIGTDRRDEWMSWNLDRITKANGVVYFCTDKPAGTKGVIEIRVPKLRFYSPSRANNMGIRRAVEDGIGIICKTDIDCFLTDELLKKIPRLGTFGLCPYCEAAESIEAMAASKMVPNWCGTLAMSAEWWKKINGYDERMYGYGREDGDAYERAMRAGAKVAREKRELFHIAHKPRVGRNFPTQTSNNVKISSRRDWSNEDWGLG